MNKIYISVVLALSTIITYITERIDILIVILSIFMFCDFLCSMIVHIVKKDFNSAKAIKGFIKKIIGYFSIIILCFLIDLTFKELMQFQSKIVGILAISFYMSIELRSICKNLNFLGVPIPHILKKSINYLEKMSKENIS